MKLKVENKNKTCELKEKLNKVKIKKGIKEK